MASWLRSAAIFSCVLPLLISAAMAEERDAYVARCAESAAAGLPEQAAPDYCLCMHTQISSLGGGGVVPEMALAMTANGMNFSTMPVFPNATEEQLKDAMSIVTDFAAVCMQAALLGKVTPEGGVKD